MWLKIDEVQKEIDFFWPDLIFEALCNKAVWYEEGTL